MSVDIEVARRPGALVGAHLRGPRRRRPGALGPARRGRPRRAPRRAPGPGGAGGWREVIGNVPDARGVPAQAGDRLVPVGAQVADGRPACASPRHVRSGPAHVAPDPPAIIAIRFLREGRRQMVFIIAGVAIGVGVIVFMSALLTGLQANFMPRAVGAVAHPAAAAAGGVAAAAPGRGRHARRNWRRPCSRR